MSKSNKTLPFIIVVLIVSLLAAVALYAHKIGIEKKYDEAISLLQNQDYDQAWNILKDLEYNDSEELSVQCESGMNLIRAQETLQEVTVENLTLEMEYKLNNAEYWVSDAKEQSKYSGDLYIKDLLQEEETKLAELQQRYALLVELDDDIKSQEVTQMIASISKVTMESGDMIQKTQRKYDALSENAKEKVIGYDALVAANEQYKELVDKNNKRILTENVKISVEAQVVNDKAQFILTTNLPTGMDLGLDIKGPDDYWAQDCVTVTNGVAESSYFSDKGFGLVSGYYTVEVSSPTASVQPKEVKEIIGDQGVNLKGSYVVNDKTFGKMIKFSTTVYLNAAESKGYDECSTCNGTGYIKYNYGSSDLEAYLSGHDPYTYQPCYNCDGKGYILK